jgi:hypothetical protein
MTNFKTYTKLNQTTSMETAKHSTLSVSSIRHPDSLKRQCWNTWLLLVLLFNVWRIAFHISLSSREVVRQRISLI